MIAVNPTPAQPVTRSPSVHPWLRRLPRILVMICLVLIAAISLFPLQHSIDALSCLHHKPFPHSFKALCHSQPGDQGIIHY